MLCYVMLEYLKPDIFIFIILVGNEMGEDSSFFGKKRNGSLSSCSFSNVNLRAGCRRITATRKS